MSRPKLQKTGHRLDYKWEKSKYLSLTSQGELWIFSIHPLLFNNTTFVWQLMYNMVQDQCLLQIKTSWCIESFNVDFINHYAVAFYLLRSLHYVIYLRYYISGISSIFFRFRIWTLRLHITHFFKQFKIMLILPPEKNVCFSIQLSVEMSQWHC